MAKLDLQYGKGGEGGGQQSYPPTAFAPSIDAIGQQKDQQHGQGVGDSHDRAADERKTRHTVRRTQGLHQVSADAQLFGQRRQFVHPVGRQHQQIEREMAVRVAAPFLPVDVPQRI